MVVQTSSKYHVHYYTHQHRFKIK